MEPANALGPLVTLYSVFLGGVVFVLRNYRSDNGAVKLGRATVVLSSAFAGTGVLGFLYTIGEAEDAKLFIFSQVTLLKITCILMVVIVWGILLTFIFEDFIDADLSS